MSNVKSEQKCLQQRIKANNLRYCRLYLNWILPTRLQGHLRIYMQTFAFSVMLTHFDPQLISQKGSIHDRKVLKSIQDFKHYLLNFKHLAYQKIIAREIFKFATNYIHPNQSHSGLMFFSMKVSFISLAVLIATI